MSHTRQSCHIGMPHTRHAANRAICCQTKAAVPVPPFPQAVTDNIFWNIYLFLLLILLDQCCTFQSKCGGEGESWAPLKLFTCGKDMIIAAGDRGKVQLIWLHDTYILMLICVKEYNITLSRDLPAIWLPDRNLTLAFCFRIVWLACMRTYGGGDVALCVQSATIPSHLLAMFLRPENGRVVASTATSKS